MIENIINLTDCVPIFIYLFIFKKLSSQLISPGPYKKPENPIVDDAPTIDLSNIQLHEPPNYNLGDQVATRLAYGNALASLAKENIRIIALDGDTKNSTFSEKIKTVSNENVTVIIKHKEQFFVFC